MTSTQEASPSLAGATPSIKNANDCYNKNNGGILVVPQKKKDKKRSIHVDHSKVEVLLSRESAVKLLRSFPESSLADMLHLAMMTTLECRARDVLHSMTRPIMFRTPEMKRKTRAALVNAAELMPYAVELMLKAKGCPVGEMSGLLLDYISDDSSTDCFEEELGGVTVQYRLYGKKGAMSHQVVDKTMIEPPQSTRHLEDDVFGHIVVVEVPDSPPPSPSGQTTRETAAHEATVAASGSHDHNALTPYKPPPLSSSDDPIVVAEPLDSAPPTPSGQAKRDTAADEVAVNVPGSHDHNTSTPCKLPPHSSSDEEGSSSPPTPPLSPPPPSSSMGGSSPPIAPPSLALPTSTPRTPPPLVQPPPPPPSRSTFSANPLGDMFSPPLDKPGVIAVVDDILCSQRVFNDRNKTVRVLAELESGSISGESIEWVIRGLRTVRGKREMEQRHGGLVFVGPQWGAPVYKTRNGMRRLLRGVAGKHGAGTRFAICVSSTSSNNATDNVKTITGMISASALPASAQAPPPASGTARVEPVMDGDVPGLEDWSNIRGNLDGGCQLWAWIY